MGVDTRLYIDSKWCASDIAEVIKSRLEVEEVKHEHSNTPFSDSYWLHFTFNGNPRSMFVFPHAGTPLGAATMLSLRHDEDAVHIMTEIAQAIGGLLNKADCNNDMEMFQGHLSMEDGLSYFIKDLVINKRPPAARDRFSFPKYTMRELNAHIKEWAECVKPDTEEEMGCFK